MTIKPTWPNDFIGLDDGSVCFPTSNPPEFANLAGGELHVYVLGLVTDERLMLPGDEPAWNMVAYWPMRTHGNWTITHQSTFDKEASDYPVEVSLWMPLPPVPQLGDRARNAANLPRRPQEALFGAPRSGLDAESKLRSDEPTLAKVETIPLASETVRRIFGTTALAWADTPLAHIGLAA